MEPNIIFLLLILIATAVFISICTEKVTAIMITFAMFLFVSYFVIIDYWGCWA